MSHAVCVKKFDLPSLENATIAIEEALAKAALRRHSDYVSQVWVFCSPHFSELMPQIAQTAVTKSQCMNVWGACVSGLLFEGKVLGHEPLILVAIFGEAFEVPKESTSSRKTIRFCMTENDAELHYTQNTNSTETITPVVSANTIGLLTYGANYAKMPRIDRGRISQNNESIQELGVENPLILNSEGLTFLSDTQIVTETNGLFLIQVNNQKAQDALKAPTEQTRPIGLRLHVIHERGGSWIPVMDIHADGTLGLAAPVILGQKVRLAKRTPQAIAADIAAWQPEVEKHFGQQTPQLGILFAGFERSQMCHEAEDDIAAVLRAFPHTQWIGLFGQAVWLGMENTLLAPPKNNRLCICLFNPNHV
jgi:hypothetical protein